MTILDENPTATQEDGDATPICPSALGWCTDHQTHKHVHGTEHQHFAESETKVDAPGLGKVTVRTSLSQFVGPSGDTSVEPFAELEITGSELGGADVHLDGGISVLVPMLALLFGQALELQAEATR